MALGIGLTLDNFQAVVTFCWSRERLKILVREVKMLTAVLRSIIPEIESGPTEVLVLWEEKKVKNFILTDSYIG